MAEDGTGKTFVGFGFGPIQSGLFLLEAFASGSFSRFVVAEVDGAVVEAVRRNGGRCVVNIARKNRIDHSRLDRIEILNPMDACDRGKLVEAVAESDEMATALPSVAFYDTNESCAARIIAEGLSTRRRAMPTVIYAAENHNHAAELLREAIARHSEEANLSSVETLNTVIGKMSGVITDQRAISKIGLETLVPGVGRAVLVEEFNRILISRVRDAGYSRGIRVFIEKDDLLPFEEAKLYGHNAIHAVIAYLADYKGLETIAEAGRDEWIMSVARAAFVDESGAALIRRHGGLGEALFTPDGYREYAEDLLERMVRPTLHDLAARVGRDHVRKLGYDDRLYGTMRIALSHGVKPVNLALGAAAAVLSMAKRRAEAKDTAGSLSAAQGGLAGDRIGNILREIWGAKADERAEELIDLTQDALKVLRAQ